MKKILFLSGLVLFAGCDLNIAPGASKRAPEVTVLIDRYSDPMDISVINKDENGYINLSNEIALKGFAESGQFINTFKTSVVGKMETSDETLAKMKISSVCATERDGRFVRDIYLKQYHFQFAVMDLIPPALFFQGPALSTSCSFFFEIKDRAGGVHRFSLKQLPLASIPERKNLRILDSSGGDLSFSENKIITAEDTDEFFLMSEEPSSRRFLSVFCEGSQKVMEFQDIPAVPLFRLLYSSEKSFPDGIRNCRVLSRKGHRSTGITKVFQIDFSTFARPPAFLKLSELSLRFTPAPFKKLFQPGKWLHYLNADYKDRFLAPADVELKPDDTLPHSAGVFEVEGLPEDFLSVRYSPVKIHVDTQCVSEAFPEKPAEGRFNLDLISPIPLMSVTPLEAFHLRYPENKYLPKRTEREEPKKAWALLHKNYKRTEKQTNKKPVIKCSYKFHFQDLETGAKLSYEPLVYNIRWRAGGMGVGYDHRELGAGVPSYYEDLVSEGAGNILFPFKAYIMSRPSHIQSSLKPDFTVFRCGEGLKRNKKKTPVFFQTELPRGSAGFSLPLSVFLSDPDFKEYMDAQSAVKCRTLLYRGETLLYFSPEIQILRKTKTFRRAIRMRGIKYNKDVVDEDFIWSDLKKFFFTL